MTAIATVAAGRALFLKRVFLIDAATCAACFGLFVLAAGGLAPVTGLQPGFIAGAGWLLLPCAMLFAWLGTRTQPPVLISWVAILGNLLWAGESFVTIGVMAPALTGFGTALIAAQALGVTGLALLEIIGVRRMMRN